MADEWSDASRFGMEVSPDNKDAVLVEYLGARLPALFLLLLP